MIYASLTCYKYFILNISIKLAFIWTLMNTSRKRLHVLDKPSNSLKNRRVRQWLIFDMNSFIFQCQYKIVPRQSFLPYHFFWGFWWMNFALVFKEKAMRYYSKPPYPDSSVEKITQYLNFGATHFEFFFTFLRTQYTIKRRLQQYVEFIIWKQLSKHVR